MRKLYKAYLLRLSELKAELAFKKEIVNFLTTKHD